MALGGGDDIIIKITVDETGAVTGFARVAAEQEKFEKNSQGTTGAGKEIENSFLSLGKAAGVAAAGIAAAGGVIASALNLASKGESLADLRGGFESLGGESGVINEMISRTKGLISETQAYELANKALIAGIPEANKNLGTLAELGAKLAETLGGDAKEKTEQLTQAILSGREIQLKQLGIFIDADAAVAQYAKSIGVAAEDVTELEKKQVVANAALEAARDRAAQLAEITPSVTDQVTILNNQFANQIAVMGEVVNSSPELNNALKEVGTVMNSLDTNRLVNGLAALAGTLISVGAEVIRFSEFALNRFATSLALVAELSVQVSQGELPSLGRAMANVKEQEKQAAAESEKQAKAIEEKIKAYKAEKTNVEINVKVQGDLARANKAAAEAAKEHKKELESLVDVSAYLANDVLKDQLLVQVETLRDAYFYGIITQKDFADSIDTLGKEWIKAKHSAEDFNSTVEKGIEVLTENKEVAKDANFLEKMFGKGDFEDILASNLASAFGKGLDALSAVALGEKVKGLGKQIGGTIGSIGGAAAGAAIGGPEGAIVGASVGFTLGSVLGSVADKIFGGKGDAQTQVRRSVEEYIDDILEAANFSIQNAQGKVVPLTDLILGDRQKFEAESDFNLWAQGLDSTLSNAFIGTGEALAQTLGQSVDQGGQVFLSLLEQIGANENAMNNLRLLVDELGLTFEDAETAMVEAFKNGELGALEVESKLRDMAAAFEPGRVAVGDLDGAFQALVESGAQGAISIKAIKDIAIEAQEAGINSLEALQQKLLENSDLSVEDVNKLFSALKSFGIGSLDALEEASDRTIISILANMEAAGFKFAEPFNSMTDSVKVAQGEVQKLRRDLDEIPDVTHKQLIFKIKTEGSAPKNIEIADNGPGEAP